LEQLECRENPTVIPGLEGISETVTYGLVDDDAIADTIAVAGSGGSCRVHIVSGLDGRVLLNTIVFDEGGEDEFRGGGDVVFIRGGQVAGRPLERGTLLVAAGPGGGPRVIRFGFDGENVEEINSFYVGDENDRSGLKLSSGDVNRDGKDDGLFLSPLGRLISVDLSTLNQIANISVPVGLNGFDPVGGVLAFGQRFGVVLEYFDSNDDPYYVPSIVVDPLSSEVLFD
jgi:hypothetical protein